MCDFVHLHNHSHYSLQDAACTVEGLIQETVKNKMNAIALTDHGIMYGISEFYKKSKKAGIKPIIGVEAYIVMEGSRTEKVSKDIAAGRSKAKPYNHLILLAKNSTGYKNLLKLTTISHVDGFYYKPRIDLDLLRERSEGLICTSACLAGPIAAPLVNGDYDKAKENAIKLRDIFGEDFYLELQDHNIDHDKIILEELPKLSRELGIRMIATNDIHYISAEHSIAHNILLLMSDKSGEADYKSLRYNTDQVYFKTSDEMKNLFGKYDGAIENTLRITEQIDVELEMGKFHYPLFPIPKSSGANSLDDYFKILAKEGLQNKFKRIDTSIEDRFNYELDVITKMGYSGYFLIVQDFINAAKKRRIPVGPGRGSAAGSLVAYVLGITNVNPLDYNLLFERFLNPARKSMPDIDVDFADDQRGEVIDYVKEKYGEDSVCQIVTFNRLSSKAVLRDVARVLKIPIPVVNSITKWIPSKFGRVFTLDQALKEVPELRWVNKSTDPKIQELIKYSRILEGMNRNASKHAAGVVITPGEVSDYVPMASAGANGDFVTQYNMKELDDAGILKMDFLGLRTLTIIRDAIDLAEKGRNIKINIDDIPLEDEKTYDLFAKGQTTAVFQFESAPMREYLKKLKPNSINDLAAMNALYRPGPMEFIDDFISRKHGTKSFEYDHPILEEILEETYGIIVYQEQVIQIANKVGGMSLAEADLLRRAMGKKDLATMKEQRIKFIKGAIENGITEKIASNIFEAIDKFANYGFNKSHAVAYSIVAYQTAYLKAHFLAEFLAANLSNEFGNSDKVTTLLEDCRKLKIHVKQPDINNPSVWFKVDDGKIVFGMCAIKNVGINAIEEIIKTKNKLERNFTSIFDLCSNIDTRVVNKRVLEGLVLAGAFDSCNTNRACQFSAIEHALNFGSKAQSAKEMSANSLFGENDEAMEIKEPPLPEIDPWDSKEKLAKEREVLGFYLSDHPLRKFEHEYYSFSTIHLGEPETFESKETVRICGVVTDIRTRMDKAGRNMAFFKLDDFSGSCECLMFSKAFEKFGEFITTESTILVKGKLESSGDSVKLQAEEAMPLQEAKFKLAKKVLIKLNHEDHTEEDIGKLKTILEKYEGRVEVFINYSDENTKHDFYLPHKVKLSDKFLEDVVNLIGEDSIQFLTK